MRDFAGLGNLGRGLPEGIVRLVLLAVLICLAVFTTGAPATEGPEAEAPEPAPVDVLIVDGEQVLTGNDSKEYRVVEVTDEGRLLILGDGKLKANERVELTGAAAITGKELVVGTQTLAADMPPWGGLYTKTLERGSDEARLFFETATINPGADDFNLGAIKRDADGEYYEGGIYVGDGWLEAEEALNVKTLAATNDNHDATVGATAKIWVNGDVVLTAGGTIGLAGHEFGSSGIAGARVDENGDNPDGVYSHAFVMDGGVLNMNGTTGGDGGKYDVYGAELQMKDVFISGGTVNLSAKELYRTGEDRDWANAPAVVGSGGGAGDTGVFVVSGGTVNLGDYGTIRTQWAEEGLAGAMTISGGIVNMSGSEDKHAVIRAASPHDAGPNENEAVLNIAGDATINVEAGKYGVVMSRNTQFTGGEINVDGTLVVTGSAGTGETVMDGIAHEDHVKWGDFHFNGPGGVMAIGDAGVVDFVSGGVTVKGTAGRIDGTLRVVDSPDDVGTKGAGVYASAVRIEKGADGDVFTVEELELWTAGDGGGARAGVDIDGRLVITGGVGAVEDVAKGSLVIGGRGSLTADAADFLTFTDVSDDLDVTGYTVDAALAAALSGSTGTLNLNAQNPEVAYNITSEQYAAIKNMLGMTGGKLNLLGVVVDDTLRLAPEPDGTIGVAVANPSATVTIDASGLDDGVGGLVFLKDVSVKEIALEKGEAVEKLTLTQSGVFTGSGNKNTAIIGGGKSDAVGIDAKGDLGLGIVGNPDRQGGLLGDVNLMAGGGSQYFEVNDGEFRVGRVAADGARANIVMTVSGSGVQKTGLEADGIDFSGVDGRNAATIGVSGASLRVDGDIVLNDNRNSGVGVRNNASLAAASILGGVNLTVGDGSVLTAGNIALNPQEVSDVRVVGGELGAGKFSLGDGGFILVGDDDAKGVFAVGELSLNGGTIFSDPDWNTGRVSIADASAVLVEKFAGDTTDGHIVVGRNSHFTYGLRNGDWLEDRVREVGVWGDSGSNRITAAAGIYNPLVIGDGYSFTVDGSLAAGAVNNGGVEVLRPFADDREYAPAANTAHFGANSLLVVNAGNIGDGQSALSFESDAGTLSVDEGAKLYVYNARAGKVTKLIDIFNGLREGGVNEGTGEIGVNAWNTADNLNDSAMTKVAVTSDGTGVYATVTANNAKKVYKKASNGLSDMLNVLYATTPTSGDIGDTDTTGILGEALNDVYSDNAGIRFVSRATNSLFNGSDLDVQAATVEGAAQLAAVGGGQLLAFNVMRRNSDIVRQRHSFSAGLIPHPYTYGLNRIKNDPVEPEGAFGCLDRYNLEGRRLMAVWAAPQYQRTNVSGMKVGAFDNKFSSNIGGGLVGLDFDLGDNFKMGVVGSMGGGKAKTTGGHFARTENSLDYWGVSGYAAWSTCNVGIIADGGYTSFDNEIRQDNRLGGGKNRSDVEVNAWNVGVTAEILWVAGFADIVPHMAIRYEGVGTNAHDVRSNDGKMFNVDAETQHALTVPVGVGLSKDFHPGENFRVTPYADVGALFALTGRDYKSRVRIPDLTKHGFKSRVLDAASFNGAVGVSAERGRVFGGVNYNVLASKQQTAHSVWANVGITF